MLSGAEIALAHLIDIDPEDLARLGLGGGPWLLLEPPFTHSPGVDRIVLDVMSRGFRVVLAHPERSPAFQRDPQMLESLVRAGALTSITAGSLVGRFGGDVRRFALALASADMVHNVASDAHDTDGRAPGIGAEIRQAGLEGLLEWLTLAVPAAILRGDQAAPPRPLVTYAPGGGEKRPFLAARTPQASFVTATIIPISTNTTIAICIQTQVGGIGSSRLPCRACALFATLRR